MSDNTKTTFSIEFDDDGGTVPGVTQLLNPKAMQEKAELKRAAAASASKASPPPILKKGEATQTIKRADVSFEEDSGTMPGVSALLNPKAMLGKNLGFTATGIKAPNASADSTRVINTKPPASAPAPIPAAKASSQITNNEISLSFDDEDASPAQATRIISQHTTTMTLPQITSIAASLAALGVDFELVFEKKQNQFRYARVKSHAKAALESWQEKFFYQMKLDLRTLEVQVSFQEFSKAKNPFQEDAFGLAGSTFVQVVRLETENDKIHVLLSSQSLLLKQDEVREILSGKSAKAGDDGEEFKIELAS